MAAGPRPLTLRGTAWPPGGAKLAIDEAPGRGGVLGLSAPLIAALTLCACDRNPPPVQRLASPSMDAARLSVGAAPTSPTAATTVEPRTTGTSPLDAASSNARGHASGEAGSCVLAIEGKWKCVDGVSESDCADARVNGDGIIKIFGSIPRRPYRVSFSPRGCAK
jgi:hypothetical protein